MFILSLIQVLEPSGVFKVFRHWNILEIIILSSVSLNCKLFQMGKDPSHPTVGTLLCLCMLNKLRPGQSV